MINRPHASSTPRQVLKEHPVPLYFQLEEILREQLESDELRPGDHFPTDEDLCKTYGVSRTTVRHALDRLVMEGLLVRSAGRGTVVAKPKIHEWIFQRLFSSYDDLASRGYRLSTKVLNRDIIVPPSAVAARLKLNEGEKTTRLERVRFVEGEPLLWTTGYVPYRLCPGLVDADFEHRSFFEIIENDYGLKVEKSVRTLEPTTATPAEAEILGISEGAPVHLMESTSELADGTPVEYSKSRFRGDRSKFEVELMRPSDEIGSV